jgi:CubicO group peptidase (beta-lactamase class C family)
MLTCLLSQTPVTGQAQHPDTTRAELEAIRDFVQTRIQTREMAGAVVTVARDGQVILHQAFGVLNTDPRQEMREDAIFRLASMTKPIVSVAVMQLVDEGHFTLDDPLGNYLPEFQHVKVLCGKGPAVVDFLRPITIRQLLAHTSGIADITHQTLGPRLLELGINPYWCTKPLSETVELLATLPLMHQPDERWEYGFSTDVLGRLIQKVSQKSLEGYLRDHLFRPLGMEDTHFYLPPNKFERLAAVTELTRDQQLRQIPDGWQKGEVRFPDGFTFQLPYRIDALYAPTQERVHFSAVGGLCSTAHDYMRFCQMLVNGGEWEGVRILRGDTVRMMSSNQIDKKVLPANYGWQKFGLGFGIIDDQNDALHGAYGWSGAYATYFWIYPKNRGVFILMSQVAPTSTRNCLALGPTIKEQAARMLNPQGPGDAGATRGSTPRGPVSDSLSRITSFAQHDDAARDIGPSAGHKTPVQPQSLTSAGG